jgi:hypothetical protein
MIKLCIEALCACNECLIVQPTSLVLPHGPSLHIQPPIYPQGLPLHVQPPIYPQGLPLHVQPRP